MAKDATVALWANILDAFDSIAERYDGLWQERYRALDSRILMEMILKLVTSQNRQGLSSTLSDFWQKALKVDGCVNQVRPVAASSFSEARQKLDEQCFKDLNTAIGKAFNESMGHDERYFWLGHKIFAVDGSSLNLPPQLKNAGFKLPTPDSHYPQAMLSCLFNLKTQQPVDAYLSSSKAEGRLALCHLAALQKNDVVIYDRGYLAFSLVKKHQSLGVHGVWRLKSGGTYREIVEFWKSEDADRIVDLAPQRPKISAERIRVRLVKYVVDGKAFCLATTLLCSAKYPCTLLAELYHARWGIEEFYKIGKQHLEIEHFCALSPRGIRQEVYALVALVSLTRVLANLAERDLNEPRPDLKCRLMSRNAAALSVPVKVNFKLVLHIFRINAEHLLASTANSEDLSRIISATMDHIIRSRVRVRAGRHYVRRSKRPINRWQRNIQKEWTKRKKVEALKRCA